VSSEKSRGRSNSKENQRSGICLPLINLESRSSSPSPTTIDSSSTSPISPLERAFTQKLLRDDLGRFEQDEAANKKDLDKYGRKNFGLQKSQSLPLQMLESAKSLQPTRLEDDTFCQFDIEL